MYDVNGLYIETFDITATLAGPNTDLEADASVTIECRMIVQGETVTGAGDNWSDIGKGKTSANTWFQYTVGTEGTFDLVQGQEHNDVRDVTITNLDGSTTRCFSFDAKWQVAPVAGNVKIQPLDAKPTAYIAPGQFAFHFTEPSDFNTVTDFCVTVSSGSYGYVIHLDAGFWVSG